MRANRLPYCKLPLKGTITNLHPFMFHYRCLWISEVKADRPAPRTTYNILKHSETGAFRNDELKPHERIRRLCETVCHERRFWRITG